jgi:hypothetical protein
MNSPVKLRRNNGHVGIVNRCSGLKTNAVSTMRPDTVGTVTYIISELRAEHSERIISLFSPPPHR